MFPAMGSNVVNLNKFRKKKQREERAKQAETNRIKHGLTKGEKRREVADRERAERTLDGTHLEPEHEELVAPSEETPDED